MAFSRRLISEVKNLITVYRHKLHQITSNYECKRMGMPQEVLYQVIQGSPGLPLPGWVEIRQWAYNTQRPPYKDGDTSPSLVLTGILSLIDGSYRDRDIGVYISCRSNFGSSMGLNPNAPAWTPGLCSSGERSGDSPDRTGRAAHCVGIHHKRTDGVGWLNLPVNQDKHRADKFSQRVRTAIKQTQKKGQ